MTKNSARRPPLWLRPQLLVLQLLLAGGAVAYGIGWWREAAKLRAQRAELLAAVRVAAAADQPDANDLSRLMAAVRRLPDHDTDADLLAAQAEIELVRDRPVRADELFGVIAARPGAAPAQQRLGSRILLRRHEVFAGDAALAAGMLHRALGLALAAARDGSDSGDLLRAWQAARRLGDAPTARRIAEELAAGHPDTPAARLVAVAEAFDVETSAAAVDGLAAAFPVPPVELLAMRALLLLQRGDVGGAVVAAEDLLRRAPGVTAARYAAALVFHVCALGSAPDSPDRLAWLDRRDAHLDWLDGRAAGDDPLRSRWLEMRRER